VHVIVQPIEHELSAVVKSWKSFTSRQINKIVGRSGTLWQSEPFDHLVRSDEHLTRFTKYILGNPIKADLRDWPWTGVGSLCPLEAEAC
jgi:putative transposase